MSRNRVLVALALAAAVALGPGALASEAAVIFPFSGSGTSGSAAPAPLEWGANTEAWVIAQSPWPSETSVTDFHITLDFRTVSDSGSTFFTNFSDNVDWTRVINGNTVEFFAPAGTSLDSGESFAVSVLFIGGEGIRTFEAHWTTAVPAPASLVLLGFGLAGLGAATWRRAR